MKQFMKTPYSSLLAKKNDNSKSYYMIAELIDNSIGSWVNNKMSSQLKVQLTLDMENKKIEIIDNAFGMDFFEMQDCIKLNNEKPGNVINMFGVGLKNSAFWFGKDLIVESKREDQKKGYKTDVIISKITNLNDPVEWEVLKINKEQRGTKIIIENIYDDKKIYKSDFLNEIIPFLSKKYSKYIEKSNVEINIKYFFGEDIEIEKKLESNIINPQFIISKQKEKFYKNLDNSLVDLKIIKNLKEIVKELVEENKPLEFEYKLKFNDHDPILNFVFGIQNQNNASDEHKLFKKNYGLTTYQKNRAINISPLNPLSFGEYTRTDVKRVYGMVELGDIFRPDNNKREFNFGNEKEDFFSLIKNFGNDLGKLATAVKNTVYTNQKVKSGNLNQFSNEKIKNGIQAKSADNVFWNITSKGADVIFVDDIKISINESSINNIEDKNYFIHSIKKDVLEEEYEIFYNVNHPIWKPLTNASMIDFKTMVYPLIAILGLSIIDTKSSILYKKLDKENDESIMELINSIAKCLIKYE